METILISVLLYPCPYQIAGLTISFIVLLIIISAAYGIYKLISSNMDPSVKNTLDSLLKIAGISIFVIFFVEVTLSLITIHQVNKERGFCYATPETPEGELFKITQVVTGETMDRAGLKPGDQIQMSNVNNLYRLLIDNQGKQVVIDIQRNKKKIKIYISVPELDVPLANVSFLF